MFGAQRDESGFILAQRKDPVSARHLRCAGYHHPMLRSLVMHLEGQFCAWVHCDAFDLEIVSDIQPFISAPRPENFAMGDVQFPATALKLLDDLLHIL